MKIGNKIKGLRVQKNYTPLDMAEILGVSESTYRRYENDKTVPNLKVIQKVAAEFNIQIEDLIRSDVNIIHQHNDQIMIAQDFSEINNLFFCKIIEHYEARIKELKEQVIYWKQKAEDKSECTK